MRRREGKESRNQCKIHLQDQSLMGPEQPINSDCCRVCHQTDVSFLDTKLPSGKSPQTDTDTCTHKLTQMMVGWMDGWMCVHGGKKKKTTEMRMTSVCECCNNAQCLHSSAADCVYHWLLRLFMVILWWSGGWNLSGWQEMTLVNVRVWVCMYITVSVWVWLLQKAQLIAYFGKFWVMGRQWKERVGNVLHTHTHNHSNLDHFWTFFFLFFKSGLCLWSRTLPKCSLAELQTSGKENVKNALTLLFIMWWNWPWFNQSIRFN